MNKICGCKSDNTNTYIYNDRASSNITRMKQGFAIFSNPPKK